jgi:hypothetical protein
MTYEEVKQDLFLNQPPYAHCISSDFGMGAGIVVEFNRRFDMKNELLKLYPSGWIDEVGRGNIGVIKHLGVYNLVTKEKVWHKPTYKTLRKALVCMRDMMLFDGDKKISMPKIGCGIDGLKWGIVCEILLDVFKDTDIEICVCYI